MALYTPLQNKLATIDERTWYKYLGAGLALFILILSAILFFYFRSVHTLQQRIESINEEREDTRKIIAKAAQIQKQRDMVNSLLQDDPNFKINEFMQDLLIKLNIFNNFVSQNNSKIDRDNNFVENIMSYQIAGISMRQLTQLLSDIDENPRVFTKDLDITKSKKVPHAIDIGITIATMMPK
jgi:hypothetical protein